MSRIVPRAERERGLTLIELLVTTFLLAVTTTLLVLVFSSLSQTFSREQSQRDSTSDAALGMRQLSQVVRGGAQVPQGTTEILPAFAAAGADSMTIHAYLDASSTPPVPSRVTLAMGSDRALVQTRYDARLSGDRWVFDTPPQRREIVRNIVASATPLGDGAVPPLFSYRLADGRTLSRALDDTELSQVVAVEVALVVETAPSGRAEPTQLFRTIALPNVGLTEGDD